jgi:hypothetical protein
MQLLDNKIFSNDTHLPSAVQVWQMPEDVELPTPLPLFFLSMPLEEHDTSYFAASASISSLARIFSIKKLLQYHIVDYPLYQLKMDKSNICSVCVILGVSI